MEFIPYISVQENNFSILKNFPQKKIILSFDISTTDSFLKALYQSVTDIEFCLFLRKEQEVTDEQVVGMIHIISHPYYFRIMNRPVFFTEEVGKLARDINSCLKTQGYKDGINIFPALTRDSPNNETLEKRFHLLDAEFLHALNTNSLELFLKQYPINDYCLVPIKQHEEWESFLNLFKSLNDLSFFKWYQQGADLISRQEHAIEQLSNKVDILAMQNSSYKQYLEYYHENDNSQKTIDFYKNEYEILPVWYKRIGHILKVVMGKRSFSSLFNKNVKKYKD